MSPAKTHPTDHRLFVRNMIVLASAAGLITGCMQGSEDSQTNGTSSAQLDRSAASGASSTSANRSSLRCLSRTASLVGFSDTSISLNGNASVTGSVVLLGRSDLSGNGNTRVGDTVYTPSSGAVSLHGHASAGSIQVEDLSSAEPALLEAISSADSMSVTQEVAGITNSTILSGNGGVNVIHVSGNVTLSGGQSLLLDGSAQDSYLIDVDGDLSVSGNARIALGGAVEARNVLIRLNRSGAEIRFTGNGSGVGTLVAPEGTAQISGNGKLRGAVFARKEINVSGNGFSFEPAPFCPFWNPADSSSDGSSSGTDSGGTGADASGGTGGSGTSGTGGTGDSGATGDTGGGTGGSSIPILGV